MGKAYHLICQYPFIPKSGKSHSDIEVIYLKTTIQGLTITFVTSGLVASKMAVLAKTATKTHYFMRDKFLT